ARRWPLTTVTVFEAAAGVASRAGCRADRGRVPRCPAAILRRWKAIVAGPPEERQVDAAYRRRHTLRLPASRSKSTASRPTRLCTWLSGGISSGKRAGQSTADASVYDRLTVCKTHDLRLGTISPGPARSTQRAQPIRSPQARARSSTLG